jgi:hypothetical protein
MLNKNTQLFVQKLFIFIFIFILNILSINSIFQLIYLLTKSIYINIVLILYFKSIN